MEIFISILALILIAVGIFAVKFVKEEEGAKNREAQRRAETIANLDLDLKNARAALQKEQKERKDIEDMLYKTKDEVDSIKNQNIELNTRMKELNKIKDDILKKDEALKFEISEKERFKGELEYIQKEIEPLKNDLERSLKELEQARIDAASKLELAKKELEEIKKASVPSDELNSLRNQILPLKTENEELKNKLNSLEEIHKGLQSQYDELSKVMEEINMKRISQPMSEVNKQNEEPTKQLDQKDNIIVEKQNPSDDASDSSGTSPSTE